MPILWTFSLDFHFYCAFIPTHACNPNTYIFDALGFSHVLSKVAEVKEMSKKFSTLDFLTEYVMAPSAWLISESFCIWLPKLSTFHHLSTPPRVSSQGLTCSPCSSFSTSLLICHTKGLLCHPVVR